MTSAVVVEMRCPTHGFERFKIKIIKKCNVPSSTILPQFRNRPNSIELNSLVVGKKVSEHEIETYVISYLQNVGLWNTVVNMRFMK